MKNRYLSLVAVALLSACASNGNQPESQSAEAQQVQQESPSAQATAEGVGLDDQHDSNPQNLEAAKPFIGKWVLEGSGKCTIEITDMYDGAAFAVSINWNDNAAQMNNWEYVCAYSASTISLVADKTGQKRVVTYSEDGSESYDTVYEDGSATFVVEDGKLIWCDNTEAVAEECRFVPME